MYLHLLCLLQAARETGTKLSQLQTTLDAVKTQRSELEEQLAAKIAELAESKEQAQQERLQALERLAALQGEVQQLHTELDSAAGAKAQLQDGLAACQEELKALRRQLAEADASIARCAAWPQRALRLGPATACGCLHQAGHGIAHAGMQPR
jgi:chromosome segregation ATPase